MPLAVSRIRGRYLRIGVFLCLMAGLWLPPASQALTRAELYQAIVPLTDRSEAAHGAAFDAAMRVVLVRVTGRRTAGEEAVFAPLMGNARRYVQQYRQASDNQLWVAFDGGAIERWLAQNGQPLWGHERPATSISVTVQSSAPLTATDTSELKTAIDAAAVLRGVPLLWPGAADAQRNRGDGAEGALIGRANTAGADAVVHWSFQYQDHSTDFTGTAAEGPNRIADAYAAIFAATGAPVPVEIEVAGIDDVGDYALVQTYLESLTFVSHLSVESLYGNTLRFRLITRGGAESLQHVLALNGRLQPVAAGDNGIQRFQLRH